MYRVTSPIAGSNPALSASYKSLIWKIFSRLDWHTKPPQVHGLGRGFFFDRDSRVSPVPMKWPPRVQRLQRLKFQYDSEKRAAASAAEL